MQARVLVMVDTCKTHLVNDGNLKAMVYVVIKVYANSIL